VVEELIEAKGRHPSLDMSGKFVGRDIVLLDMHTGTALLTVKVPLSTQTYAYALSREGKRLARSSGLSVGRLSGSIARYAGSPPGRSSGRPGCI
jgi:hypothetical protein